MASSTWRSARTSRISFGADSDLSSFLVQEVCKKVVGISEFGEFRSSGIQNFRVLEFRNPPIAKLSNFRIPKYTDAIASAVKKNRKN